MELVIIIFLSLMFFGLYIMSFFLLLIIKNNKKLFFSPKPKKKYYVSFLIPAYNEEESIEDTIKHISEIDYPKELFEIIAINDGSNDNTKKVIKKCLGKYSNLLLLDKKNSGKADSLNKGIKIAKGELIAVVDADSFPSKDSLKKIIGFFNDEKVSAVTSFVSIRNKDESFITRIQSIEYVLLGWTRKLLDFVDSVYVTNGPLSVYRKKSVEYVGGFDPKSITEDIDITWNLLSHGYKTRMSLNSRVSTIAPIKFRHWLKQRERWGVGGFQALSKYRKNFFKKGLFGFFVIPFVFISIYMAIFGILFSGYLFLKSFLDRILITSYSFYSHASAFHLKDLNFYPSSIFFYLLVLFIFSIVYYSYVLYRTGYNEKLNFKRFFNLLFYILVYLTLYGIVWFPVLFRYLRKDFRW